MVRIPSRKLRPTKIQFFCQKLKNGEAIESLLVDESNDRKCYKVDNMSIFILQEEKKNMKLTQVTHVETEMAIHSN